MKQEVLAPLPPPKASPFLLPRVPIATRCRPRPPGGPPRAWPHPLRRESFPSSPPLSPVDPRPSASEPASTASSPALSLLPELMLPSSMAPASPAGRAVASSASSQGVVLPAPGPLAPCRLLRWWRPPGGPPGARSPRRQAPCRFPASYDRISRSRLHFLFLARRRPMPFNRSMLHWVVSARLRFESLPRPRPSPGRTSCTTTPGDAPSPTMLTTLQVRLPLPCTTTSTTATRTTTSHDDP